MSIAPITPAAEFQYVSTGILPESAISAPAPEAQPAPSDYEALYKEQKADNERLQAVITANRNSKPNLAPQSVKAAVLADRVKAQLGPVGFLKATRDEKLMVLGVDPKSITDDGLQKIFGKRNDPSLGKDLMRSSPARYAQLRQAALLLNLYAA